MATQSCDVTKIQDEDTLRKMWQETEDFGRKKEIRAHMYKIREARLRDFYSSGEVCKDIQRTYSSPGMREQRKGGETTHHADSLLDHSFLSLKSKEIRDSESPTRDISYKISDTNKGWNIKESNERSQDGKTHTVSRQATTSGSQKIDGGVANYAARNDQKASVYHDGDDKNFTKSVGAQSSSVVKQEAHGGDENSKFYSTSTSSKSSSKYASEQKSSTGDVNQPAGKDIVTRTYTSNIPEELKQNPNYIEGKTKVFTETKTMPDGSTRTTTRYETTGGRTATSQSSSSYSTSHQSSEQRSSSTQEQRSNSTRMIKDSRDSVDNARIIKYSHPEIDVHFTTDDTRIGRKNTREDFNSSNQNVTRHQNSRNEKFDRNDIQNLRSEKVQKHEDITSERIEKHQDLRSETHHDTRSDHNIRRNENVDINITRNQRNETVKQTDNNDVRRNREEIVITRQPTTEIHKTVVTKTIVGKDSSTDFINIEKQQRLRETSPVKEAPQKPQQAAPKATEGTCKPKEHAPKYEQPEKRQPIRPGKSEIDSTRKPTEGQYDTTYRTEFTNKRISVDVSATHDAFARSLRSVTPERDNRGSIRSLRTSTTSLRSSSSPEKNRHPGRFSPERRGGSPRKCAPSPDKTTRRSPQRTDITRKNTYSTDTITRRNNIDSSTLTRRPKKPIRSRSSSPTDTVSDFEYRTKHEIITDLDTNETTIIKTNKVEKRPTDLEFTTTIRKHKKVTERSPTSPLSDIRKHSPSPTKDQVPRRSSLKVTRSRMDSPTKEDFKPFTSKTDKILRRTDTYEERCRQILGIAEKKKVEKNITEILFNDRTRPRSPEKKSPTTSTAPRKPSLPDAARRPEKRRDSGKVQEFPAQIRKSPEKRQNEPYPQRKSPTKEASKLNEFPSQIRKSPERRTCEPYPIRTTPVKEPSKLQEFPSQIRKSPERRPSVPHPERTTPVKNEPSKLQEFPSQTRKSPEYQPIEPHVIPSGNYPDLVSPSVIKKQPCIIPSAKELPERKLASPIRKTPERESPDRQTPDRDSRYTSLQDINIERTTSNRDSPDRSTGRRTPLQEFPSQIRKTPERETAVAPPKKSKPLSEAPQTSEFPAQKKKQPKPTPEDEIIEKTIKYLEGHLEPIEEPMFVQKFITKLGSDDEDEPADRQSPKRPSPVRRINVQNTEQNITTKDVNAKTTTTKDDYLIDVEITNVPKTIIKKTTRDDCLIDESITKTRIDTTETTKKTTSKDDYYIDEKINLEIKKSPERLSPVRGIPDVQKPNKTTKKDLSLTTKKQTMDFIQNEKIDTNNKTTKQIKKVIPKSTERPKEPIKTSPKQIKTVKEIRLVNKASQERIDCSKIKDVKSRETIEIKFQNGGLRPSQPKIRPVAEKPLAKKTSINEFPAQRRPDKSTPDRKIKLDTKLVSRLSTNKISKVEDVKITDVRKIATDQTRKVVSATINLSPKSKPAPQLPKTLKKNAITSTVTTVKTTKLTRPVDKVTTKPIQNGHVEVEVETNEIVKKTDIKPKTTFKSEPKTKPKLEKKCISTKSITINNAVADQREIIVDLLRSKSSREESPDRVWPVTTEEDSGIPRYPDQIVEPDEPHRRPKKINDIPLTENEDVTEFSRITELVDTKITEADRVQETDDCLLTVNEKVSKFLNTADKLTKPKSKNRGPAPKVERPTLIVDDDLEEDDCLLSVTDKVNKFITTAEKLTVEMPDRPKSPRCQNFEDVEETLVNVSEKVSKFTTTVQDDSKPKGVAPKVLRPDLSTVDDTLKTDECLLSVSDKVTKFINTAEKLTIIKKEKSPPRNVEAIDKRAKSPPKNIETDLKPIDKREKSPPKAIDSDLRPTDKRAKSPPKSFEPDCPTIVDDEDMDKTPVGPKSAPVKDKQPQRNIADTDATPKSTKRPSQEEKTILNSVSRLRSTESIKKAKAIFESVDDKPKQRDILSRPSVFEARRTAKKDEVKLTDIGIEKKHLEDVRRKLNYEEETRSVKVVDHRSESPKRVPDIITPDDSDVPGYMRQLDRSLRPKSPHKESVLELEQIAKGQVPHIIDENAKTTKFGVVLKRTDSDRVLETRRRSSTVTVEIDGTKQELEIEEIFDLKLLLAMMETAIGYDIRRRIRAQIRIVKKMISENKLTTVTTKTTIKTTSRAGSPDKKTTRHPETVEFISKSRASSPEKKTSRYPETIEYTTKPRTSSPEKKVNRYSTESVTKPRATSPDKKTPKQTEYQTKYIRKDSHETRPIDNKLYKHTDLITEKDTTEKISEYESSYSYSRRSSETKSTSRKSSLRESPIRSPPRRTSPEKIPETRKSPDKTKPTEFKPFRKSPERKMKHDAKLFNTDLKRISTVTKTVVDDKPEWVTQRVLRKVTDRNAPSSKRVVSSTSTTTSSTTTKKETTRKSPSKDLKPTDVITSSYGVGPTDENGSPLFGLRALRAQNKNEKSKGTVVQSSFYSKNGEEPVGEISVTEYSSDPKDLGPTNDLVHKDGLLCKTTTQKFGHKDTPSYKTLTDKKRLTDKNDEMRTSSTTTTKVTRRGSVKEMSQKFLENAVETLKSERQSSYPKAGLILRSSSFKNSSGSSREGSPPAGGEEIHRSVTVTESSKANTFLTNTSKVSGMQDVITRMKTEDIREGDSAEDVEARSLLNKFLGSQVILSGLEGHMTRQGASATSTAESSSSSSTKRTTKVTSTVTENGIPKTTTRTFTHPITPDVLETIWDEQTLRLLLEQSTEYEERTIVRARLKQVMAEREACSEFVEKTLEETQTGNVQEKVETTKKSFSEGPLSRTQVTTTRVTSQQITKKPMSPFAKFRQLDKQNSINTPPSTPKTPTSGGPMFKFTDPNLSRSASTIKERLLQWCQMKTKEYENIKLDNFSTSWADGLAFCALVHHFLPDAFDYHQLTPNNRRHNFTLAFQVADEKADIAPLLDVDDMVATRRPDWKCVFTYVQSIYRRFKDAD